MPTIPTYDPNEKPISVFGSDQKTDNAPVYDPNEKPISTLGPETEEGMLAKAYKSFIPSAKQFASDITQPILHPIETVTSLKNLGLGIAEKLDITEGTEHEAYADALAQHFKDRYGSLENAKKTFETDPVGFVSDASMILTGGGTLATKAPSLIGKIGSKVKTFGEYIDPVSVLSKTGQLAGKVGSQVAGLKTHAGAQSFKEAYKAGLEGGEKLKSYYNVEPEQLLSDAQKSINKMAEARGKDYIARMTPILQSEQVLDFNKVIDKTAEAESMLKFKGEDKATRRMKRSMKNMVDEVVNWGAKDPAEFHTPAGMDALKQKLWYYVKEQPYGSPQRKAVMDVYHAVKKEITNQFPAYAEHMKAYEDATNLIDEIEGSLSLGKRGSADAALRKLQTVLKRDINPAFENRAKLAEFLVENGSPYLMTQLAGLAHQPWFSRGLGRISTDIGTNIGTLLYTMGADPVTGAALFATSSPKLMGNLAVFAGALNRYPSKIPQKTRALYMTGRAGDEFLQPPEEGESVEKSSGGSVTDRMHRAQGGKSDIPYLPNEAYLNAVKQFEGYEPKAKWDIKQHSVGYGTRAKYPGEEITREEAERRFREEMQDAGARVNKFKYDMPEPWKAALTSLTFNAGSAWMDSGLGEAVKKGDWNKARNIFLTYNKAEGKVNEGLRNRRIAEMKWLAQQPKTQVAQGQTPAILQSRPETDQVQLARMSAEAARSAAQPTPEDQAALTNLVKETATPVRKRTFADFSPEEKAKFLQSFKAMFDKQQEAPASVAPMPEAPKPEIPIVRPYGMAQGGGAPDLPGGSIEDYLYMPEMEQGSPIQGSMAPKEANISGNLRGSLGPVSGNIGGYAFKSGPMKGADISNIGIQYNPDEDTTLGGEYYKEGPEGFGVMGRGSLRYAYGGTVTQKMHQARKKKEDGGAATEDQPLKERGTFVPLGVTQDDKVQLAWPKVLYEPAQAWKRMVDRGTIDLNDPEAVKQQAQDAFNVAGSMGTGSYVATPLKPAGVAGLFGGEIAAKRAGKTIDLYKAKIMDMAGASREKIWEKTGFWKNPNDQWMFEINDKNAALTIPEYVNKGRDLETEEYLRKNVEGRLKEQLSHPEAYKIFPELGETGSTYMREIPYGEAAGEFQPYTGFVKHSGETPSTALHEMQHFIDKMEGRPFGANPEQFMLPQEKINEASEAMFLMSSARYLKMHPDRAEKEIRKAAIQLNRDPDEIFEQVNKIANSYDKDILARWYDKLKYELDVKPYEQYTKNYGEALARLVQKRKDMTPEERAKRPPWMDFEKVLPETGMEKDFAEHELTMPPKQSKGGSVTEKMLWRKKHSKKH